MIYITIEKYNMEFLNREEKFRVYFNPDNSVAIFEDGDTDLWDYVFEKGEKLKEAGFFMNQENAEKIRQFLNSTKEASPQEVASNDLNNGILISDSFKRELLESLEGKQTVQTLRDTLVKLIKNS